MRMTKTSKELGIHAVDLFCGIGGLTHGLRSSGISVKAGVDVDHSCKYIYEKNNPGSKFILGDVRDIGFCDIAHFFKGSDVSVLAGCAPCQPFSSHTRKTRNPNYDNCSLIDEFARLVKEGSPDLVSMENVPGLAKHRTFHVFLKTLDSLDYKYNYGVLSCAEYGVPQNRKRLVLLASRLGKVSLPRPTGEKKTVVDLIGSLPEIEHGFASKDDPAHITLPLSKINLLRIRQSKPGGSWKDWDVSIINKCHTRAYYPGPYGRMRWDSIAPTITTQFCYYSTGRFGHPNQDRTISLREASLLQTFPSNYQLVEPGRPFLIHKLARHIGNAVPVRLAESIGESILEGAIG